MFWPLQTHYKAHCDSWEGKGDSKKVSASFALVGGPTVLTNGKFPTKQKGGIPGWGREEGGEQYS